MQDILASASFHEGLANIKAGKLYYKMFGKGEPIILIHGGPGLNHHHFLPQMLELAKENTLILYDQRGSGKSLETEVNEEFITVQQFVSDLEDLREHLGYEKITLMGHSWGGFLAMLYASRYSQHLSSLILLSCEPATSKGLKAFSDVVDQKATSLQVQLEAIKNSPAFKAADSEAVAKFYRLFSSLYCYRPEDADLLTLHYEPKSSLSAFKVAEIFEQNFFSKEHDIRAALKTVKVPTLIIHGAQDPIPVWTAQEIKEAIEGAKLVILDRCGHFPYIEQAGEFFEEIRIFLNR